MKRELSTFDYEYGSDQGSTNSSLNMFNGVNNLGANLSILYYFMFIFSIFGNGLVLVIIHRYENLTTPTNILLLNLVVASLIFMSSLPFMGVYLQLSNWIFGTAMCKIVWSVYYLGYYSSVLFLTLLTFDRHLAVVYPLCSLKLRSQSYAVVSCAVVWLLSSVACIRPMIIYKTFTYMLQNSTYCQEYPSETHLVNVMRNFGFYLQLILFLIFPLVVIIYCYVRIAITVMSSKVNAKFKTVRLIFVIVVLFLICWTPYNITMLMVEEDNENIGYALEVTRVIAYSYFCISPIFYTFVGKKFQNHFRQLLVKRFPGLKKDVSVSQQIRTNMSSKSTQNEL